MFKAILFDAFGTLVEIEDKRNPFAQAGADRNVMVRPVSLDSLTDDPDILSDLDKEIASITIYDDVIPMLVRLRAQGVRLAIGSNLAQPYGEPLRELLGAYVDHIHLSYDVGVKKPDKSFFIGACEHLGVSPIDTLMVGDNYHNDFLGAEAAGLNAVLITRPNDTLDTVI